MGKGTSRSKRQQLGLRGSSAANLRQNKRRAKEAGTARNLARLARGTATEVTSIVAGIPRVARGERTGGSVIRRAQRRAAKVVTGRIKR